MVENRLILKNSYHITEDLDDFEHANIELFKNGFLLFFIDSDPKSGSRTLFFNGLNINHIEVTDNDFDALIINENHFIIPKTEMMKFVATDLNELPLLPEMGADNSMYLGSDLYKSDADTPRFILDAYDQLAWERALGLWDFPK